MSPEYGPDDLEFSLMENWSAADAELDFEVLEQHRAVELRSKRVFLDPPVVSQVTRSDGGVFGLGPVRISLGQEELILTYLANLLRGWHQCYALLHGDSRRPALYARRHGQRRNGR